MKKIFVLILTLALVFSLAAVPVYATEVKVDGGTTKDVTATYNEGTSGTAVYSVTITWGAMNFDYTIGAWNPNTHEYAANWTGTDNTVTITNHSNVGITANLAYEAAPNFRDVTGSFGENATLMINSAVGTKVNEAPSKTAMLTLDGVLAKDTNNATVGTITVTIE